MGFDDSYKKISSTGQLYRQIGNSVGVNITEELSKQIILQGLLNDTPRETITNKQKVINGQTQITF